MSVVVRRVQTHVQAVKEEWQPLCCSSTHVQALVVAGISDHNVHLRHTTCSNECLQCSALSRLPHTDSARRQEM